MKTRKLVFTMIAFLITSTFVFAQEMKTEKFKVYGNCGMCENRIEKATTDLDGVTKAEWNMETSMLKVTFDESKLKVEKIHKAVAAVGHDTDKVKAKDEVYKALPGCCKYERESSNKQ